MLRNASDAQIHHLPITFNFMPLPGLWETIPHGYPATAVDPDVVSLRANVSFWHVCGAVGADRLPVLASLAQAFPLPRATHELVQAAHTGRGRSVHDGVAQALLPA